MIHGKQCIIKRGILTFGKCMPVSFTSKSGVQLLKLLSQFYSYVTINAVTYHVSDPTRQLSFEATSLTRMDPSRDPSTMYNWEPNQTLASFPGSPRARFLQKYVLGKITQSGPTLAIGNRTPALTRNNWRASLVPAAAVIPAPIPYIKVEGRVR